MHRALRLGVYITILMGSIAVASAADVSLSPRVFLPDGTEFVAWECRTAWTKTYVVDQMHPEASDENPGTEQKPFRTIGRAAVVLRPGERVIVKSGVYREEVVPRRGVTGPEAMIGCEAAPGARVLIKGSRDLEGRWTRSKNPDEFSEKLWMAPLPPSLFPGENPFALENASAADVAIMPWATAWANRPPFSMRRGIVFQDGRRLQQLAAYVDLMWVPGSFWVDPSGTVVHVHPFDDADPNAAVMEVTVRQHLFAPSETDLGYIRVAGFHFLHAGNGYPRTGVGAPWGSRSAPEAWRRPTRSGLAPTTRGPAAAPGAPSSAGTTSTGAAGAGSRAWPCAEPSSTRTGFTTAAGGTPSGSGRRAGSSCS
jgi:hypothetical protein